MTKARKFTIRDLKPSFHRGIGIYYLYMYLTILFDCNLEKKTQCG